MSPSDSHPRSTGRAGPYELLEELGRGGMGVVYLARRADGQFEKQVAVKLIRAGMDSEEILARFEREQQVLASLEHPGVARLIDGGLTDEGRPFLVMELVEGEPIDRWCEERKLSVDQRVELFREVCAAVDSAHRSLVVHRDLKPGNILVTADGRPKLLDFGIAKVITPVEGTPVEDVTRTEARQLTPEYASPEQVRGDPITTATDVYSLGVILYRLLTGRLPIEPEDDSLAAMEQAICEEEPPAPSALEDLSRSLRKQLAGDLDRVVLKALRKEPDRRYRSAAELAADLRRHQTGHPVEARPDTWSYRAERFARRNPGTVSAGTLVVLSLITGLVVSVHQSQRAREAQEEIATQVELDRQRVEELQQLTVTLGESRERGDEQRELAEQRAAELELLTERLREETAVAERERQRAEGSIEDLQRVNAELVLESNLARERYRDLWEMARAMVFDVRDALAQVSGSSQATELVANLGVTLLDELAVGLDDEPVMQHDLVNAYLRLAATLGDIGGPSRGKGAGAAELLEKAVAIAEGLHAEDPGDADRIYTLAAALNSRGIILLQHGRSSRATADFRRAAEVCRCFEDETPRNPKRIYLLCLVTRNLARVEVASGRYEEGLAILEKCIPMMEYCVRQDPERSYQLHQLFMSMATVSAQVRGAEASVPILERSYALFRELARANPGDARYKRDAATAQLALSRGYSNLGRLSEALELALDRLDRDRELVALDPGNAGAMLDQVHTISHLGELLARQGKWEELIPYSREGQKIAERILELDPENVRVREMLGQLLVQLGRAEFEQGQFEESERCLSRAMHEAEEMLAKRPEHHSLQVLLYSGRANYAQLHERWARDESEPRERRSAWCRQSIDYFELARHQLEEVKGDATVFGDREFLLQRLRRDERRVRDYLESL